MGENMDSLLERSKDADLDQLIRELAARRHGNARRSLRLSAWKFTVRLSYAIKRLMDVVGSGLGMILLSPVFLVIAAAVKFTSPGPVFFSQVRVGRYGRHFRFYKFRSMFIDAEARKAELMSQNESKDGVIFKMKNDPRITKVGRFLRRTSLDELPQLWNVFIGDMSLVGPRPEIPHFVDQFRGEIPLYMVRHQVRPGITGWAQVNGLRGDTPIKTRVEFDLYYIENWNIWFDLRILLATVFKGKFLNDEQLG